MCSEVIFFSENKLEYASEVTLTIENVFDNKYYNRKIWFTRSISNDDKKDIKKIEIEYPTTIKGDGYQETKYVEECIKAYLQLEEYSNTLSLLIKELDKFENEKETTNNLSYTRIFDIRMKMILYDDKRERISNAIDTEIYREFTNLYTTIDNQLKAIKEKLNRLDMILNTYTSTNILDKLEGSIVRLENITKELRKATKLTYLGIALSITAIIISVILSLR